MTQAASDRPPITRLPMANIQDRLVHNRQAFGNQTRELQVSLTSHGANGDLVAFRAEIAQTFYQVQVTDVIGHRQPPIETRSGERREGKACVSKGRCRWQQEQSKKT